MRSDVGVCCGFVEDMGKNVGVGKAWTDSWTRRMLGLMCADNCVGACTHCRNARGVRCVCGSPFICCCCAERRVAVNRAGVAKDR